MRHIPPFVLLFLSGILYILVVAGIFSILQNESVYNNTLGKISSTERRANGDIQTVKAPFLHITPENLRHWDAPHYERIKDTGYWMGKEDRNYLFAFYPGFPLVWKILGLDIRWICLFNYLLYISGLVILFSVFLRHLNSSQQLILFLLLISLPSTVVFLIPYSEAVFFFLISLGIWAYMKDKVWLLFPSIMFATMTRRASFLLIGASLAAVIIMFIRHRNSRLLIYDLLTLVFPILAGTFCISIIQYLAGSGSFFSFIRVTGSFSQKLGLPTGIYDWSHNSFPMNIGVLFIFIPLVIAHLGLFLWQSIKHNQQQIQDSRTHKKIVLSLLSCWYSIAAIAFILLYQGGILNSTFRGILCTPFFFICLIFMRESEYHFRTNFILFILFTALGLIIFLTAPYTSNTFRFGYLSLPMLIICVGIWLVHRKMELKSGIIIGSLGWIFLSATLVSYLFDIFLGNGWIYT
ncbi:MAG: hypothetical protein U0T82_10590 [Bacteroidales bacterium]